MREGLLHQVHIARTIKQDFRKGFVETILIPYFVDLYLSRRSVIEAILLLGVFTDFDRFVVYLNVFQGSIEDVDMVRRQYYILI